MAVTLPDVNALGRRPVPRGNRGIAQQDTASAGMALANFGQTLSREVGAVVEEQQKRDDTQAVFEARRKLDDWERSAIYDPESGAIGKTGKDAFDLPNSIPKSFDEFAGTVAGEIQSPRAKRAFQELATSRRAQVADWAAKHSTQQRTVYERASFEADLTSFQDRAARLASTPTDGTPEGLAQQASQVKAEIAIGQQRIVGFMSDKGLPAEAIAVATKDFSSRAHEGVIRSLIQSDPIAAKAYFDANKKAINADRHDDLMKPLKAEVDDVEASRFAAKIAVKPYAEQLAAAADITDTDRRQKTLLRIRENQGMKVAAQQEVERNASDLAWQTVGQGKRVPETVLSVMNGRERVQLQDYLVKRAEHMATQGSKPVKTDPMAHAKLLDLQASDPQEFARTFRAEAFAYRLAGSDLEQLSRAQAAILNPKAGKDIISFNNKVTARIEMMGLTDRSDDVKRGEFRAAAQKEFERLAAAGKPLAPKDEDAILDSLTIPGKSGWFDEGEAKTYGQSVATGKPYQIRNDDDYTKLPSGAVFLDPKGVLRVKP